MTLTFGEQRVCRVCKGSGQLRGMTCANCDGSKIERSAHARTTDPDTSHAAAASISSEKIRASQTLIVWALRNYGPMTDDAIFSRIGDEHHVRGQSPSGTRTRRAELVALGKVRDSGRRQRLASGRYAIVWEIVE